MLVEQQRINSSSKVREKIVKLEAGYWLKAKIITFTGRQNR